MAAPTSLLACSIFDGVYDAGDQRMATAYLDPYMTDPGIIVWPEGKIYEPKEGGVLIAKSDADDWFEASLTDTARPPSTLKVNGLTYRFRCVIEGLIHIPLGITPAQPAQQ